MAPSKPLVQFKAGRLNRSGKTLSPDSRVGNVIVQRMEDTLLHFQWKDLETGQTELDFVLFAEDAEFSLVRERVYMLHFKSSSQKYFFWMQHPNSEQDESLCHSINRWITRTTQDLNDEEMDKAMEVEESFAGPDVDLTDVITPQYLRSFLPLILPKLTPHLPSDCDYTLNDIEDIVRSSTFKYALKSLTHALQSPQHPLILKSLAIPHTSIDSYSVLHFLTLIQKEMHDKKN